MLYPKQFQCASYFSRQPCDNWVLSITSFVWQFCFQKIQISRITASTNKLAAFLYLWARPYTALQRRYFHNSPFVIRNYEYKCNRVGLCANSWKLVNTMTLSDLPFVILTVSMVDNDHPISDHIAEIYKKT